MSKFEGDTKALMVVINWSAENAAVDLTSVTPDFPETGIVEASTLRKENEACSTNCLGRQQAPKVLLCVFWKFPLSMWATWQQQYSPTAPGALKNIFPKPFGQAAAAPA